MIGWMVVFCVLVVLSVSLWIKAKHDLWGSSDLFAFLCTVGAGFVLLIMALSPIAVREHIANFKGQRDYFINHAVVNQYEDVALTQQKIEINTWLFEAQARQEMLGIFSFYPESIQELELIP